MTYLLNAGTFLIQTLFGFFIVVFLLRAMLIAINAAFNQPLCRFVYQLTNPLVTPWRRWVPRWRRIELASLLIAWLLALLELVLLAALFGAHLSVTGALLRALIDTADWTILILLVAIFALCVLSFIPGLRHAPDMRLLTQFTAPVVSLFRRLLPPFGGMDFSSG